MSTNDALAGAGDIIAETISDDAAIRAALRRLYRTRGVLWAKAATDEDSVYRLYYDYREPVSRVQGHRVLAVNRGEREGMLKAGVEIEDALALQEIRRAVFRGISISNAFVNACCEDAWRRLIEPSAEREIRGELTDAADEAAIRAFGQNLQPLLMQPPLRNRVTMALTRHTAPAARSPSWTRRARCWKPALCTPRRRTTGRTRRAKLSPP